MFMLSYPFTFYAIKGLSRIIQCSNDVKRKTSRISKKVAFGAIGVTVLLGSVYLATPILMNSVQVGVFVLPNVSAHFCSAPTVPYQDAENVAQAVTWLDENMDANSCTIMNYVFDHWGRLYLNESHVTIDFRNDAGLALEYAIDHGFSSVYFVWWNQDIGWYEIQLSNEWISVFDHERISVYQKVI